MAKTLPEIALQLKNTDKKVQLIYAFNGTGKTRLSRILKELVTTKNVDIENPEFSRKKFLYYNAFTKIFFIGIMIWLQTPEQSLRFSLTHLPHGF